MRTKSRCRAREGSHAAGGGRDWQKLPPAGGEECGPRDRNLAPLAGITAIASALAAVGAAAGCPLPVQSFETGLEPWTMDSSVVGALPFDPSITRTSENAHSGRWSARYFARGHNDDGVLWLERPLALPAGAFDLTLSFWMWSPHQADVGNWEVVACIAETNPEVEADFTVVGYTHRTAGWAPYTHQQRLALAEPQTVWIGFGFSVVFEVDRTHDFDDVAIDVTPCPPQCLADLDGDGDADVFDLLSYLDLWFLDDPAAERTGDDPASIDVFDLLSYLSGWFEGC